ncbi:hypothetical protein ACP5WT_05095 [Peptoniphilus grossensis]
MIQFIFENRYKYISQEGKEFIRCNDRYRKRKIGYITITKVYRSFDWNKEGQKPKESTYQKHLKNIEKNP